MGCPRLDILDDQYYSRTELWKTILSGTASTNMSERERTNTIVLKIPERQWRYIFSKHFSFASFSFVATKENEEYNSSVVDVFHSDPFGVQLPFSIDGFGPQPFKFQGKERLNFLEMNAHDHGWRKFFHAIGGRAIAMDPLKHEFYPISPYVGFLNNPLRVIDPDGRRAVDLDDEWDLDRQGNILNHRVTDAHDKFTIMNADGI